ncbi:DUF5709 domain-containing protein [Actinomycetospora atypica]|uniref:DUF5709 domain-containing protein n=1 Tax=Actinomycetospora atypica TaxID=1290095 RepID=A0ABV9YR91_9PSEU
MTGPGLPESPDEMPGDDRDSIDDTSHEQLDEAEVLDGDAPERSPEDPLDEGWSPNERPRGTTAWGTTPLEEERGEPLDGRLRREEGLPDDDEGDGLGDESDTDGELYDDEVGTARSGRLVLRDDADEGFADDVGVDGAGASAEEAAMHVVGDER